MSRRLLTIAVLAPFLFWTPSALAEKKDTPPTRPYHYVEVERFDVQPGVDFPFDDRLMLDEALHSDLSRIHGVQGVLRDGETLPPAQPVLLLTGTITRFTRGSEVTRTLIGFGAGSAVVDAHIKCYDATTRELLFERDVRGRLFVGYANTHWVNSSLAIQITKNIIRKFFPLHG